MHVALKQPLPVAGVLEPTGAGRWPAIAALAAVSLALVVGCSMVWDSDVPGHLKCGQWMLHHGRVLDFDPFSVDGQAKWLNIHWLFQLLLACLHDLAGFPGLVLLNMAALGGIVAVLALFLRKRIPPAWLLLCGLVLVLGIEGRFRVRPEIMTYLFLAVSLVLVESVRQGASPRRLWWLVPLNAVWVNMHGVFIVGPLAMWAALLGAWVDRLAKRPTAGGLGGRGALAPALAATLVCFIVTPWPVEAALHPLLLRTRLAGEQQMYSLGVEELRPTYLIHPLSNFSLLLASLVGFAVLQLLILRYRRAPLGHALWLGLFAGLAALAVRNVPLLLVPGVFLLALYGGGLLRRPGPPGRYARWIGAATAWATLALTLLVAGLYATEWMYRWQQRPASRFGFGFNSVFLPVRTAEFLGQSSLSGDVLPLNFGDGATLFCYMDEKRKVWMDGRLEAHPREKFERLHDFRAKLLSARTATDPEELDLPPTVRFLYVRNGDSSIAESLARSERFKLLFAEPAGALFARLAVPTEQSELLRQWQKSQPLPASNLDEYDKPLSPAGPDNLLGVPTRRHWYRQNVTPTHFLLGSLLFSANRDELAVRYLELANRLALAEPVARLGMLAQSHQRLAEHWPVEPDEFLPADPNTTRALALYQGMELSNLASPEAQSFALVRVRALIYDRQIDQAVEAIKQFLARLPIPDRWHPSQQAVQLRDDIKQARQQALLRRAQFDFTRLWPAERALLLLRKDVGLINAAIGELEQAQELPERARLMLGDLHLRKGLLDEARQVYSHLPSQDSPELLMRQGLCEWAQGSFDLAIDHLRQAVQVAPQELPPRVYLALLYEQLGQYAQAAEAAGPAPSSQTQPSSEQPARLLAQIRARLKMQGFSHANGVAK